jgi:dienelactone hydrolase
MVDIVLFHSALGLRPGVGAAADVLRAAGHRVTTPDYYDGEVFDDLDAGIVKRDALGYPEIMRRGLAAVAGLPHDLVVAGFSLGTGPAETVALRRPGVRAAVLLHGVLPVAEFGGQAVWPAGVGVQVHRMARDPWVDDDEVLALTADVERAGATLEDFTYEGDGHLFADPDLPGYDPAATALMWERVVGFLSRLPG